MTDEQIKKEAEERYPTRFPVTGLVVPRQREAFIKGGELQSRIKELEQENSLMKEALQGTENTYFYEEIKKRDMEIERLKGLVRKSHDTGWVSGYAYYSKGKLTGVTEAWNKFKQDNNL